jgi:hypothetical protein
MHRRARRVLFGARLALFGPRLALFGPRLALKEGGARKKMVICADFSIEGVFRLAPT